MATSYTKRYWRRLVKRDGRPVCHYCGVALMSPKKAQTHREVPKLKYPTVDHVVPISKGGAVEDVDNMVLSCRDCNAKKADT